MEASLSGALRFAIDMANRLTAAIARTSILLYCFALSVAYITLIYYSCLK